jgi:hypothetical protein
VAQITEICAPESTMLGGSDLRDIGGSRLPALQA